MERVTVADAERDLRKIVNRVHSEGISIELLQGNKVLACLTPATPHSPVKVGDLKSFLERLPQLGDDAEDFAKDSHGGSLPTLAAHR